MFVIYLIYIYIYIYFRNQEWCHIFSNNIMCVLSFTNVTIPQFFCNINFVYKVWSLSSFITRQFYCLSKTSTLMPWFIRNKEDCRALKPVEGIDTDIKWTWISDCECTFWISTLKSHEIQAKWKSSVSQCIQKISWSLSVTPFIFSGI
jgi:hypothetical protein